MLEPLLDEMAGLSQTPDSVRRKVHQSPPDPLADAGMVNPRTPLPYERHNRCGCHVLPLAHIFAQPIPPRFNRRFLRALLAVPVPNSNRRSSHGARLMPSLESGLNGSGEAIVHLEMRLARPKTALPLEINMGRHEKHAPKNR